MRTITTLREEIERGRRDVQRHSNNYDLVSSLEAISRIAQSVAQNYSSPGAARNADGLSQGDEDPSKNEENSTSATRPLSIITNTKSPSNEPGLSSHS